MSKKGDRHFGAAIIDEVLLLCSEGKTYREIGERFGIEKKKIERLLERHRRKQRLLEAGIMPRPKGRPRKVPGEDAKDIRIRQLEMENDLLRSFRSELERR